MPGNLLHVFLACQTPIFIEGAFAYRKTNLAFDIEGSAKNFFFGCTKSADDVAARARPAQGFALFRKAVSHLYRDHDISFFLRSAPALRVNSSRASSIEQ